MILEGVLRKDNASNVQKTFALSLAGIMSTAINVVLQMLLARYCSTYEIAIYMQSILIYTTLVPMLQLGISNGLYYVLVHNKNNELEILTEGICITFASTSVFALFIILGGSDLLAILFNNDGVGKTSFWLVPYFLFCIPESIVMVGFVYYERLRFVAYYNTLKSLILVIVLIVTVMIRNDGYILFASRVIVSSFFSFIALIFLYRYIIPFGKINFTIKNIKNILKISLPLSIASITGILSSNLDKILVSNMLSTDEYVVFQMGAYEIPIIGIITNAVSTVMIVEMTNSIKKGDVLQAMVLFRNIVKKTSFFLMPIMVFFFFAAKNVICFLFTEAYLGAVPVFLTYLFYIPIRCVQYGPMIVAFGKSKIIMYREFASLIINILLSVILMKLLGIIGVAIATVLISYIIGLAYNLYSLSKWTKVSCKDILPIFDMFIYFLLSLPGGIISWIVCENMFYKNYLHLNY